jgi:predicted RNase H-like HicB family nuclease
MNIQAVEEAMKLDIVLEEEEDGTYSVHCPALRGCHSQGRTRDEAIANIQEAIELYLEVAGEIAKRSAARRSGSSLIEIAV